MRSRDIQINSIAREFGGGGHKKAVAVVFEKKNSYFKLLGRVDRYLCELGYENSSADERTQTGFLFKLFKRFCRPKRLKNDYAKK